MSYFLVDRKKIQAARISLNKFYGEECMAHGAYLVAIAIGLFTFIQAIPKIEFGIEIVNTTFVRSVLATFAVVGIYALARIIYWGSLANAILWVKPIDEEKVKEMLEVELCSEEAEITILHRLHCGATSYIRNHGLFWRHFYSLKSKELWVLAVSMLIISYLLP